MNRPHPDCRPSLPGARDDGFTLLEVLVAVAIFAIAAQLAFGGLRQVIAARDRLIPRQDAVAELRQAVTMLSLDLGAATSRPVRDALGSQAPALQAGSGEELVSFSRLDAARPALLDAVGIYRVSYRLRDGQLLRDLWPVTDRVQGTRPLTQDLLGGLAAVTMRFKARDSSPWSDVWPAADTTDPARVPRAVEVTLVFDDGRRLRRLLLPRGGV
jgi:general secretion pathway protein J